MERRKRSLLDEVVKNYWNDPYFLYHLIASRILRDRFHDISRTLPTTLDWHVAKKLGTTDWARGLHTFQRYCGGGDDALSGPFIPQTIYANEASQERYKGVVPYR